MLKLIVVVLSIIGYLMIMLGAIQSPSNSGRSQDRGSFESSPLVLELFTSQGCSSCPPADNFLRELAQDPEWKGQIVPLAFHVDYWNYLGWEDPFSKKAWTERQGDYVQAMGGSTMYTPQIVIQGSIESVGSKREQVKRALLAQMQNPRAHLFKISLDELDRAEGVINGTFSVEGTTPESIGSFLLVAVAFETGMLTKVSSGENAGKTLKNDFVVRNLIILGQLQEDIKVGITQQFEIVSDGRVKSNQLGLAVFVQDSSTMHILGAAVRY